MRPTLEFVPLKQFHVEQVTARKVGRIFKGDLSQATLDAFCAGRAAEALLADGVAVACGGLLDEKLGRCRAWALIGDDAPFSAWPALIERMRTAIDQALSDGTGLHRVYAETIYDWPQGHKLLLHLGMAYEGLNRGAFAPDKHGVTYARVRDDVAALPTRVRILNQTAERCLWEDSMGNAVPWAVENARREARRGTG